MGDQTRSLHEVIEATVELAAALASQKGLSLICKLAPECRMAFGFDAWRVTQIVTNLISNALLYTVEGAISVRANCIYEGGRQQFKISVTDTGPGISGELQETAFAPPDLREMIPNSNAVGYGLLISKQLCEFFDGELEIVSEKDSGTTVTLTAPLRPQPSRTTTGTVLTSAFKNTCAVIIDNDVAARRLLEAHLRSWGIRVTSVLDKDSAIFTFRNRHDNSQPVSMLFVTHRILDEDLAEVIEHLKLHNNAPVMLVMTGPDLSADNCQVASMSVSNTAIRSPVRPSELFDCISQHPLVAERAIEGRENTTMSPVENPGSSVPNVLLVEDNIVNQCVATEILKRIGVAVTVANNGLEALGALDRGSFDFVFMDCQMPEMDGFEATRQIRTRPALEALPVVALTANALSGDRQRCLDAGMSDYLSKPFTKQQLEDMLAKWLGETRIASLATGGAGDLAQEQDQSEIGLVDESVLEEIKQLDPAGESSIFDEIVLEFLSSSRDLVARLDTGAKNSDVGAVERAAHALKSSSAALGLRHFSEQCARLEEFARAGQNKNIKELWAQAKDIYERSANALQIAAQRKVA